MAILPKHSQKFFFSASVMAFLLGSIAGKAGDLSYDNNYGADPLGGAAICEPIGGITISGSYGSVTIYDNDAPWSGQNGGAFYAGGDIIINTQTSTELTIVSNDATEGSGGAFYSLGTIQIGGNNNRINVSRNSSSGGFMGSFGGGAFYAGSDFLLGGISGGTTFSNNSGGSGGAIYAGHNVSITTNTQGSAISFTSNTSSGYGSDAGGGAIAAGGDVNISPTGVGLINFTGNSASNLGGAIKAGGSITFGGTTSSINLSENAATVGGALYAETGISFTGNNMGTLNISNNTAYGPQGGALNSNTNINISGSNEAVIISGNQTHTGGTLNLGNAFYAAGNITINTFAKSLEISNNGPAINCISSGGAFYADGTITIDASRITQVDIKNNTAKGPFDSAGIPSSGPGGAFYAGTGISLIGGSGTVFNVTGNTTEDQGGAFYTPGDFSLTLASNASFNASGNNAGYGKSENGGFLAVGGQMSFNIGTNSTANIGNAGSVANGTDSITQASTTSGSSLSKTGAGSLVLWADNHYTGKTTVEAGSLVVKGSIASPETFVNAYATLAGNGTIKGNIFVLDSATLMVSPEATTAIGTLHVTGNISLSANSNVVFNLGDGSGASYSQIAMTGGQVLVPETANITLRDTGYAGIMADRFDLFTNAVSVTNFTLTVNGSPLVANDQGTTVGIGGRDYYLSNLDNNISLVAAIPEPSTYGFCGILAVAAIVGIRRRFKSAGSAL